jgi:NhaA family Na+:H+ antiporter
MQARHERGTISATRPATGRETDECQPGAWTMSRLITKIQDFIKLECSAGVLLLFAAIMALIASNSIASTVYGEFLSVPVAIQIGALAIDKPLLLWINDGLMAVFFFLVGLEIKREVLQGELSSLDKAMLPVFAAVGGMAVPALIYWSFNAGDPEAVRGWAIPAATDIAFALGVLTLFGRRAPVSLKIFLLAVAILDDLGAIIIIALFYTSDLSIEALSLAAAGVACLFILNRSGVKRLTPYAVVGLFIWVCVLKSGVHATLAGVITALAIPLHGRTSDDQAPLHRAEHNLHPWVTYLVLPVFAFANAGVSFDGLSLGSLAEPVPLGIVLGLIIGKPVGVMLMTTLAVRLGLARLPDGSTWRQVAGVACLTGIGFTMSLFIGSLAFESSDAMNAVRLGVLTGSIVSALLGAALLVLASRQENRRPVDAHARAAANTNDGIPRAA